MSLKKVVESWPSEVDDDAPRDDGPVESGAGIGMSKERVALQRALARRDECLARKRNYSGRSTHVRRKLEAALRAAESDVAILRYALGESLGSDAPEVSGRSGK